MSDHVSQAERSRIMALIRGKDTKPELVVRRLTHAMGYRYRLHRRDLPGTPDLVFPRHRKVIFVHGCFWHQHDCPRGTKPASNTDFWNAKLAANVERDERNRLALTTAGWSALTIWECETKCHSALAERVKAFLA